MHSAHDQHPKTVASLTCDRQFTPLRCPVPLPIMRAGIYARLYETAQGLIGQGAAVAKVPHRRGMPVYASAGEHRASNYVASITLSK